MAISSSTKQQKLQVIKYFPTKAYGQEGDIVVVNIKNKGVFFCVKANGNWYAQTTMQPLNKINDVFIKHLKSEKITLKNIKNSEISTDKFLVSSNGNIRYRTGNQAIEDLGINSFNALISFSSNSSFIVHLVYATAASYIPTLKLLPLLL